MDDLNSCQYCNFCRTHPMKEYRHSHVFCTKWVGIRFAEDGCDHFKEQDVYHSSKKLDLLNETQRNDYFKDYISAHYEPQN